MQQEQPVRFDIRPYVGALPITFGMHRDEVHLLFGQPQSSFPTWNKTGFSEHYTGYNVGYDNDWVVKHMGFGPGYVELSINGTAIWTIDSQPDPNPVFLALDPEPLEFVGFWNFLKIGVTTTGYHDGDENQLAVTAFPRERIEYLKTKARPADTSKYATA